MCKIFADDTKIIGTPGISLQDDINTTVKWSVKWQMQFNAAKCKDKVLHFGKNNIHTRYFLNLGHASVLIDNPAFEKDLGIFFQNDYLFDIHINNIVKRANVLVGLIKISFSHMNIEMFINLYCTMVRAILEYGGVIWSPTVRKHIFKIEAVQHRATKLVHTLKDLSYGDRLIALNLYSLTYRRRRRDLLQVYI